MFNVLKQAGVNFKNRFMETFATHVGSMGLMAAAPPVLMGASAALGGGPVRSGLIGAAIGGIAGVATGDNYNSTSTAQNFLLGATAGAGIGSLAKMGARAIVARGIGAIGMGAIRTAGIGANAAYKGARMAVNNPRATSALLLGGAAITGGLAMSGHSMSDINLEGAEQRQSDSSIQDFQNSAGGLVFGLHAKRHR